jgi:hypothetical protein
MQKSAKTIAAIVALMSATQIAQANINSNDAAQASRNYAAKRAKIKAASAYKMTNADCLTINVYKEANTTTLKEQRLVTSVVLNRVQIKGGDACSQIFAPKQFSWTNNIKQQSKFASQKEMLAYYNVPVDSFAKLSSVVADVLLERTVTDFAQRKGASAAVMYHDKSIKKFNIINESSLKVVARTKYFVWYVNPKMVGAAQGRG